MANHIARIVIRASAIALIAAALYYFSQSYLLTRVRDAQAGIGMLFVGRYAVRLFFMSWLSGLLLFAGLEFQSRRLVIFASVALTPLFVFVTYALVKTVADDNALAAVSDMKTPSGRLDRYIDYSTTFWGTELANRLGLHPNASARALWTLYNRGDESTLYCIARNPKAPKEMLQRLADHSSELIHDAAQTTLARSQ